MVERRGIDIVLAGVLGFGSGLGHCDRNDCRSCECYQPIWQRHRCRGVQGDDFHWYDLGGDGIDASSFARMGGGLLPRAQKGCSSVQRGLNLYVSRETKG